MFELALSIAQIDYKDYLKVIDVLNKKNYYNDIIAILGESKSNRIKNAIDNIDYWIKLLRNKNIGFISYKDERFPSILMNIPNPCYALFYIGNVELLNSFSIAIIGSRKPSTYGKYVANKFSSELSNFGITIISGFANGVDTFSHKGATNNNGNTIAVLGTAIDNIYPASNKIYAEEIIEKGNLIVSEFAPGIKTFPFNFVQRNRIISALSRGLLVVEAGEKSGTLTTVDFALEQGKLIFAVPGNINSLNSIGTNNLIKLGAKITTDICDILEEFDYKNEEIPKKDLFEDLSNEEKEMCLLIKENGSLNYEEISLFTNFDIKYIIGLLSVLEIKGVIQDIGNNTYTLK